MTEVGVTPPTTTTIGQQNTHSLPSASPRKRSFEEIDGLEGVVKPETDSTVTATTQACSASVYVPADPPPAATSNDPGPPSTTHTTHDVPDLQQQSRIIPTTSVPSSATLAILVPDQMGQHSVPAPPPNDVVAVDHTSAPVAAQASPKKKVKLTAAEKEAKEKRKAEEKAKKEEEKRLKEEDKKRKEEEREEKRKLKEEERQEKRKLKEEEKQAKEEERRKKEEEKEKKERSQMRLNAFFTKPAGPPTQFGVDGAVDVAGKWDDLNRTVEHVPREKSSLSDYELEFPPFFVQSHVNLAAPHRFERDTAGLEHGRENIDKSLKDGEFVASDPFKPADLFRIMPYKRRRGKLTLPPVKEILMSMQDSSLNHVDLTGDEATVKVKHTTQFEDVLRSLPMKSLKFGEDVRPPYNGTFTKRLPEDAAIKLSRNPFLRAIDDLNYDYDSEAEWEEPEEGEDLNSEAEDDASDDGDDDMDDFLDDAGDQVKRKAIVGDLEPICSGLRWDDGGGTDTSLKNYKVEVISETLSFPIDPFSDMYWKKATTQSNSSPFKVPNHPVDNACSHQLAKSKQPQWFQWQPNTWTYHKIPDPTTANPDTNQTGQTQKPIVPFPPDQISEFKSVVSGSDLTKAGLIEVLKKRFPKVSKGVIKDTLSGVAVRSGQKEVDKRWVLI